MQNQELSSKLARARKAQARALQRFAQMQEHLAQLEARQQAAHTRLHAATPSTDAPEANLRLSSPASDFAESAPGTTFLPENGELELQEGFAPSPPTDREQTDRITTRHNEDAP